MDIVILIVVIILRLDQISDKKEVVRNQHKIVSNQKQIRDYQVRILNKLNKQS